MPMRSTVLIPTAGAAPRGAGRTHRAAHLQNSVQFGKQRAILLQKSPQFGKPSQASSLGWTDPTAGAAPAPPPQPIAPPLSKTFNNSANSPLAHRKPYSLNLATIAIRIRTGTVWLPVVFKVAVKVPVPPVK